MRSCSPRIGQVTSARAEIQYVNRLPSGEIRGSFGPLITKTLPLCEWSEPRPGTGWLIFVQSGRIRTKWLPCLARIVPSSACEGES